MNCRKWKSRYLIVAYLRKLLLEFREEIGRGFVVVFAFSASDLRYRLRYLMIICCEKKLPKAWTLLKKYCIMVI